MCSVIHEELLPYFTDLCWNFVTGFMQGIISCSCVVSLTVVVILFARWSLHSLTITNIFFGFLFSDGDNEISFSAGDVIFNVDRYDPSNGWFYGRAPNGKYGWFPSNYVQFIRGDQVRCLAGDLQTCEKLLWILLSKCYFYHFNCLENFPCGL